MKKVLNLKKKWYMNIKYDYKRLKAIRFINALISIKNDIKLLIYIYNGFLIHINRFLYHSNRYCNTK